MKASYRWLKELVPGLDASPKDLAEKLTRSGLEVEATHEYGVRLRPFQELAPAAAVVAAVSHREFLSWGAAELSKLMGERPLLVDVKGIYDQRALKAAGIRVWRL